MTADAPLLLRLIDALLLPLSTDLEVHPLLHSTAGATLTDLLPTRTSLHSITDVVPLLLLLNTTTTVPVLLLPNSTATVPVLPLRNSIVDLVLLLLNSTIDLVLLLLSHSEEEDPLLSINVRSLKDKDRGRGTLEDRGGSKEGGTSSGGMMGEGGIRGIVRWGGIWEGMIVR